MTNDQHPETARFLSQLMRFGRRLAFVAFVRHMPTATAVAIVATVAAVYAAHPTKGQAAIWLAGCAMGAAAAAAAVALVRTWSLSRTALALDKRFRLSDRAVTALEFAESSDSVSRLIVADASAHLAVHSPGELSLELPPRLGWISAGVVGASIAFAVAINNSPLPPDIETSHRDLAGQAARVAGGLNEPSRSPTAPAGAATRAVEAASALRRSSSEPAAGSLQGETPLAVPHRPNPEGPGGQSKPSDTGSSGGPTSATDTPGGGRTGPPQSSAANPASGGPRSGVGAVRNDRGTGPGGGPAVGSGSGAGGVQGTARSTGPLAATGPPAKGSSYAARFRSAWNHAESPLARERLPAGLRTYVRDYFLAIRPNGEP